MVGGTPVTATELPYVVALAGCTGVYLARGNLLTSAHCVSSNGEVALVHAEPKPVTLACRIHPDYVEGEALHDLAICANSDFKGHDVAVFKAARLTEGVITLAGYGARSTQDQELSALRRVDLEFSAYVLDAPLQLGTANHTSCFGDSGGPALLHVGSQNTVFGIIQGSRGALCASVTIVTPLYANRAWLGSVFTKQNEPDANEGTAPWSMSVLGPIIFGLPVVFFLLQKTRVFRTKKRQV
jgi:Trypsin